MLNAEIMGQLWPHCPVAIRAGMVETSAAVFAKYGIDSPLMVAHAMAQFSEECGAGTEIVENMSYSAPRIVAVWPSRFSNVAAAMPYAHNPQKLADNVYGSRMGNRAGTDDGYNYRGRGGSQVTGHDGYAKLGQETGLDLLGNPDLVNDPQHFLECAVADFILCGCLPFAKNDDVRGVTHHLNGGYIGLADRIQWLARWKAVLKGANPEAAPAVAARPAGAILMYGDKGFGVLGLQERLAELGYMVGQQDQDFGDATRAGVLSFQAQEGLLPATGIVDQATEDALATANPKPITEERANADADDLRAKGSGTIASADKVKAAGKTAVGVATAIGTADQTGVLDKVQGGISQVSEWRTILNSVQDVMAWASAHWYFGAVIAGGLAWYFGHDIIQRRVADHRSGAQMGR